MKIYVEKEYVCENILSMIENRKKNPNLNKKSKFEFQVQNLNLKFKYIIQVHN